MHSLLEAIHMLFKGNIAKDKRTKDLAKRIKPGEIAIIDHKDLDEIAANSLVNSKIKAIINLEDVHLAQAMNYLEAYNLQTGLLINFGAKSLQFKRLFNKSWKSKNPENQGSDNL